MNLKKKSETKAISNFANADLFQKKTEEIEESEDDNDQNENEDENNESTQVHRLNWVTSTNLYDSAILVKEISSFF